MALVCCAFAPLLMRAAIIEPWLNLGVLSRWPCLQAWIETLLGRDSVRASVLPEFADLPSNARPRRATQGRDSGRIAPL